MKLASELMDVAGQSLEALRNQIDTVRYGAAEGNWVTFNFEGCPYRAQLKGRNRDLMLCGMPSTDAAIALRTLLDGHAERVEA